MTNVPRTQNHQPLESIYAVLSAVEPIKKLVCIGAVDTRLIEFLDSLDHSPALYVDISEENIRQIEARSLLTGWDKVCAKLGSDTEIRSCYHYSLAAATSAQEPIFVKQIWPNIQLLDSKDEPFSTVDEFLSTVPESMDQPNWLILNSLDHEHLLEGAPKSLDFVDVLVVATPPFGSGSNQKIKTENHLSKFKCVATSEGTNPLITVNWFLKDSKTELALYIEQLKLSNTERSLELEKERDKYESLSEKRLEEFDSLSSVAEDQRKQIAHLEQKVAALELETAKIEQNKADLSDIIERKLNDGIVSNINQLSTIVKSEIELLTHETSLLTKTIVDNQAGEMCSPSQLGQDLWVLKMSKYKKNGFFVEFGATDGVLLSNTYLLEKHFGWKGILAEPNIDFFNSLERNRNCICENTCIYSSDDEEVSFLSAGEYGTIEGFSMTDAHSEKRSAYKSQGVAKKIKTTSLNTLLERNNAPVEIDYISIDTEGSEFEILKTFDFDKWKVALFTIEHNNQVETRNNIRELLESRGYERIEANWDDWYFNKDHLSNPQPTNL